MYLFLKQCGPAECISGAVWQLVTWRDCDDIGYGRKVTGIEEQIYEIIVVKICTHLV